MIHDVGLSQFRLKMDAVPGIPTTQWFTPKITTEDMKKKTGNPDYTYELSCDQMCGKGHFSMRGVIIIETMEEYKKWLAEQKPEYLTVHPEMVKPSADSVAATKSVVTAQLNKK